MLPEEIKDLFIMGEHFYLTFIKNMFDYVLCEICGHEIAWEQINHTEDGVICCGECKSKDDMNHVFGIVNEKASALNFIFNKQ